jgi:predicted metal-dependent hydrolase
MRRYWINGDPFLTHFMNALSVTFPPGERMFMDAVRAVRDQVKNPETLEDIKGFLAQEALHSREHSALNEALHRMGYPVRAMEKRIAARIATMSKYRTKKMSLAVTVALEHLTALLGHKLLTDKEMRGLSDPDVLPIWMWHAVEEMEHKAVAFDTYEEVFGDYATRAFALFTTTIGLFGGTHVLQYYFLKKDGRAHDLKMWARGLWMLYGKDGFLQPLLPMWRDYFRRDFHPWQTDDSGLIAEYERVYAQATAA